eukprot:CAMPEP_0177347624 /NCGR_PEP_ID=MMETSP0368-20130122/29826_1 /TAXON_ID=447022 ORGANISM="Scrippsiella hangoei-like, Strain SHHI-4" /NCGR_SAMPLE_ID=MMETSP0368 /ASSEMBLY_ACC=CAM_ASM_000363 /LENGTH=160 /DNA_ID=CAMNT_0018809371 /DNA_START=14 /DNA_END=495 /DNA_ORIENTATION=-
MPRITCTDRVAADRKPPEAPRRCTSPTLEPVDVTGGLGVRARHAAYTNNIRSDKATGFETCPPVCLHHQELVTDALEDAEGQQPEEQQNDHGAQTDADGHRPAVRVGDVHVCVAWADTSDVVHGNHGKHQQEEDPKPLGLVKVAKSKFHCAAFPQHRIRE